MELGFSTSEMRRFGTALSPSRGAEWAAFAHRIDTDDSSTAAALVGTSSYYDSDYIAHNRPGFMFSVHSFSKRTIPAACVNEQGKLDRHLSDGATALYKTGHEYDDIFPVWNWTHPRKRDMLPRVLLRGLANPKGIATQPERRWRRRRSLRPAATRVIPPRPRSSDHAPMARAASQCSTCKGGAGPSHSPRPQTAPGGWRPATSAARSSAESALARGAARGPAVPRTAAAPVSIATARPQSARRAEWVPRQRPRHHGTAPTQRPIRRGSCSKTPSLHPARPKYPERAAS